MTIKKCKKNHEAFVFGEILLSLLTWMANMNIYNWVIICF